MKERDSKINALRRQIKTSKEKCAELDESRTKLQDDLTRAGEQLQEAKTQMVESKEDLSLKMTELQVSSPTNQ